MKKGELYKTLLKKWKEAELYKTWLKRRKEDELYKLYRRGGSWMRDRKLCGRSGTRSGNCGLYILKEKGL